MAMSGCTPGKPFALSSLVVVSESGDVLRAGTALPSLMLLEKFFMLPPVRIHGSCHKVHEKLRDKVCKREARF